MAIHIVKADGSGDFTTHALAFAACGAGDTVETGDSETYTEQVTIPALDGLTWQVSTGCTPTVTFYSGDTITVNDGATGLTINGVTLDNTGPNSCLHLMGDSTGLVVEACTFTGARATAISGAYYAPGQDITLVDSSITCAAALSASTFAALSISRCEIAVTGSVLRTNAWRGTIDRCEIYLSDQAYLSASFAWTGTYSGAVAWTNCLVVDENTAFFAPMLSIYDTTTPYSVLGCTFVGVGAYALANIPCIWLDVGAGNLGQIDIRGNIITGFVSGLRGNAGTYTDAYNDVWGCGTNWAAGTAQGATSISADPLFVGGGDYRLQTASPCLGTSADLGLTEDLDGDPRPALGTARYDIGAYNSDFTTLDLVSATPSLLNTITATFSEAVTGADLTIPVAWNLIRVSDSATVVVTNISIVTPSSVALTTATMLQETQYQLTAPATITDTAGNPIGTRIALFTTGRFLDVYHESEQGIRVIFDAAVKQVSELESDDALNPSQYLVVRADSGWYPALLTVLPRSSTEVTLKFAGPDVRRFEFATLYVSGNIAYTGGGLFPNCSRIYEGCAEPDRPLVRAIETSIGLRDIKMPQFGPEAGTLPVLSGDYQIETPQETMKKLVIRALSLVAGEFAHAPQFGSLPKLKGTAKHSELQRISRDAKNSLLSLPNVLDAMVTTSAYNNGVLRVDATVKTKHLGTISVSWAPAGAV